MNILVRLWLSNQARHINVFSMKKDIYLTPKLFEESLIISSADLPSNYWTAKKWSAIYHTNTPEQHAIFLLVVDRFLSKWAAIYGQHYKQLCGGMEILLDRSLECWSANWCKFTAWCTDVLTCSIGTVWGLTTLKYYGNMAIRCKLYCLYN